MKHITETLDINIEQSKLLEPYLGSSSFAVLDIETTGLSPVYSSIILMGLIVVDPSKDTPLTMHQLFAITPHDEFEILEKTLSLLNDVDYIVTFNGKSFDMPFLNKRLERNNLDPINIFNLDLFLLLKNYSNLSEMLPRMNQKALEEYAGIDGLRQDRISGGESVDLYNSYLETGSSDLEKRILLHNSDDVKQLLRLLSLLKHVEINRAFYNSGYPLHNGRVTKTTLKKNELLINGKSDSRVEYISFPTVESPYSFRLSASTGEFELELPIESLDNNSYVSANGVLSHDSEILNMPFVVNDYIILKDNGEINYLAINLLAQSLMNRLLKSLM